MKQNLNYSKESMRRRQGKIDRRNLSFKFFLNSFFKGRRVKARRQTELEQGYYTDRYEKCVAWSAFAIIILSATDAFFTLNILEKGGSEVNPFMLVLLAYDTHIFFIVKMAVTITCVLFALVHIKFHVFRIVPMKYMLKSISAFYLSLIAYEMYLLLMI